MAQKPSYSKKNRRFIQGETVVLFKNYFSEFIANQGLYENRLYQKTETGLQYFV